MALVAPATFLVYKSLKIWYNNFVINNLVYKKSIAMGIKCKNCKWNIGSKDYKEGVFIDCVWHWTKEDPVPPCCSEYD